MTKTIAESQWYKVVYCRYMGILKFIRKRDNAHSYWDTGIDIDGKIERIKQWSHKQINEKAQKYEYYK